MTDDLRADDLRRGAADAAGPGQAPGGHPTEVRDGDTAERYWDRFHAQPREGWSLDPNPALVREATDLPPGSALDVGCGEGADALWLARRGWTVTAVDVARPVLRRARDRAAAAGVADRIDWQRHDLERWRPEGVFDLVTSHYLHSPLALARGAILRAAASVVAPGGVLLVVGHVGPMPDHADAGPGTSFPTPHEVLADLDLTPPGWRVERAAEVARGSGDGHPHRRIDSVVRVRRL